MGKLYVTIVVAISVMLCGCATVYNPATEQNELIFINTPSEVSLGNSIATKISKQYKISKDIEKLNRVNEIGQKIAMVSDRKDLKYRFSVIEDNELNAFTTPGGYIYINSGVVEKSTEDELACVIGHEIGHVAARHIVKKIQAQLGYDILITIASRKAGLGKFQKAVSLGYNLVTLGYSREDEMLADRLGSKYAYKAGYDPYAMISFLKKLQGSKNSDIGPVFLRSHPYTTQRISMLEKQIPTIIAKALPDRTETASAEKRPLKVMCPECRRIFPGRTNYCPYDGTKL
ncbi:MAG: M48 family metalloprotease [Candidatus Omnitrophica bacterium]|nr:M48 family metalloprotease [Candidatus Omnitrophota bacterium]MBU4589463.1 M48 family metalloprotease [Candidatus Omnitrophota bacterium]